MKLLQSLKKAYVGKTKSIFVGVCLCFLMALCSLAATAGEYRYSYFRNLSITDGLSENNVRCIIQDHNGFMWFGTKDGLNRYDGVNFKKFQSRQEGDFDFSYITHLCEDRDGLIWVGSDSGVGYYNPETEHKPFFQSIINFSSFQFFNIFFFLPIKLPLIIYYFNFRNIYYHKL